MNIHSYQAKAQVETTVDSVRALLARYGAGNKLFWITETGYSSDSSRQSDPQYQGLQGQAQWLQDRIPFLLDTVRADKVFWFQLYDDPDWYPRETGGRYHGLLDKNGNPKPAYFAYCDLIRRRTLSVEENPARNVFFQICPDPFHPGTAVSFSLSRREFVVLKSWIASGER